LIFVNFPRLVIVMVVVFFLVVVPLMGFLAAMKARANAREKAEGAKR
jgi:hypothetical protein